MGCACVISNRHGERSCELPLVVRGLVPLHSAGEGPQQRPTAHGEDAIGQNIGVEARPPLQHAGDLEPGSVAGIESENLGLQEMGDGYRRRKLACVSCGFKN